METPDIPCGGHKLGLESQTMDLHPYPSQLPFWLFTGSQLDSFASPVLSGSPGSVSGEAEWEGKPDQWKDKALYALCELGLGSMDTLNLEYAPPTFCCEDPPLGTQWHNFQGYFLQESPAALCPSASAVAANPSLSMCLCEHPHSKATDIGLNTFVYLCLTFALLKGQASAAETGAIFLIITYYCQFPVPKFSVISAAALAGAVQHKVLCASLEALPWITPTMLRERINDHLGKICGNSVNFLLQ